jgi:hypothetical protein
MTREQPRRTLSNSGTSALWYSFRDHLVEDWPSSWTGRWVQDVKFAATTM